MRSARRIFPGLAILCLAFVAVVGGTSGGPISAHAASPWFSDNFEADALGAPAPGWAVASGVWTVAMDGSHVLQETDVNTNTVKSINVGGAIIPILMSLFLIVKNDLYRKAAWGVAIVSLACYLLAELVPGVGIAIPVFYPPVIAAIVALSLSRRYAAPLAYACGSLGTLIGADLMNLGRIRGLGAPVMSIGGAGTFDGIFVVGLIAVLLAAIVSRFNRALSH